MAYPSGSSNIYRDVQISGSGNNQLGNTYHYGPSQGQQILQAILQSLFYPEMGQRGRDVLDAGAGTFEWLYEGLEDQSSDDADEHNQDGEDGEDGDGDCDDDEADDDEEGEDEETLDRVNVKEDDGTWEGHSEDGREGENSKGEQDEDGVEHEGRGCCKTDDEESDWASDYSDERSERSEMSAKLRSWLTDDEEKIFWVTGKPGSGKSTFMKFLRDHEDTSTLIHAWAKDERLVVADHFFWLPGTALQHSLEGLMRSLLHAVLVSLAEDIASAKIICDKQRWNLQSSGRPWSQGEFKRMVGRVSALPGMRVLFLIDGLDEFCPQHKHEEFMEALMKLLQQPGFKSCVSSRPWDDFSLRLERSPSLCLDLINRYDILSHVRGQLYTSTWNLELVPGALSKVARLIVDRSHGVFLWVELVLQAVKVELKKDRGVSCVSEIVEEIPFELERYIEVLILERIAKTSGNVSDTASALRLAIRREEYMIADVSRYEDESRHELYPADFVDFWLLSRDTLNSDMDFPTAAVTTWNQDQRDVMLKQTRSFLELACKDLLVLRRDSSRFSPDQKVEFLHRTVFDYIRRGSVNLAICQRSPAYYEQPNFVPNLMALRCEFLFRRSDFECDSFLAFSSKLHVSHERPPFSRSVRLLQSATYRSRVIARA